MQFVCNLNVPRTEDSTGIPSSWVSDLELAVGTRGFLAALLTYVTPGEVVPAETVGGRNHPDDRPMAEHVAELVQAGYLVPVRADRYELVHPAWLAPLPA